MPILKLNAHIECPVFKCGAQIGMSSEHYNDKFGLGKIFLVSLKLPDKLIGDPLVTSIVKLVNGNISGLGNPIDKIGQVVRICSCDWSVFFVKPKV